MDTALVSTLGTLGGALIGSSATMITQVTANRRAERSETGNLLVQIIDGTAALGLNALQSEDWDPEKLTQWNAERFAKWNTDRYAQWSKINTVLVQFALFDSTGIQHACRDLREAVQRLVEHSQRNPGGVGTMTPFTPGVKAYFRPGLKLTAQGKLTEAVHVYLTRRWWRPHLRRDA